MTDELDGPLGEFVRDVNEGKMDGDHVRVGSLLEQGRRDWRAHNLGFDTEESYRKAQEAFFSLQYQIVSRYADKAYRISFETLEDAGHDIWRLASGKTWKGPFGEQAMHPDWTTRHWMNSYLREVVFYPFLGQGEAISFSTSYYRRKMRNDSVPDDRSLDKFLEKERYFQPHQVCFFNTSTKKDTVYEAVELRLEHLHAAQRAALYEQVTHALTQLIFSEIHYPANPFARVIDRLLQAAVVLNPQFSHPMVAKSPLRIYTEDNEYFPSGYWANNATERMDPLFLGNCNVDYHKELLHHGDVGVVIGGRGIGMNMYETGLLAHVYS